ncbi:MAG: OmpA family protein [Chitinophagaceae bacterium]|nr:OmpA family protein [Chitinophagaceae bacterium]
MKTHLKYLLPVFLTSAHLITVFVKTYAQANQKDSQADLFKVNSKFDFIAGDKVIALDDFFNTNIGDFPAQWSTNGSGEVVTIDGHNGKWLELKGNFTYFPEFIKTLPANFTIEFDVLYNYSQKYLTRNILGFYFISSDKTGLNDPVFKYGFNKPGKGGAGVELHSYQPNTIQTVKWENKQENFDTETKSEASFLKDMRNNPHHISIWRQNDRLRVYLNDNKILDASKLLASTSKPNLFKIAFEDWGNEGRAYITNFRFAESVPDMRSKLITEGKFVTSGIYFNKGSDKIRAESYGILRQIAEILKSDEALKIKIVGHTDSEGDPGSNLELSKRRALSVKNALAREYNIAELRLTTDGKGETEPVASNKTEEGKANNRRVEFFRM